MATSGSAQWQRADEAALEPHAAISDNFSRILEGGAPPPVSSTSHLPPLAPHVEAPRVWIDSLPRASAMPPAFAASSPAYGAVVRKAEPVAALSGHGRMAEYFEVFPMLFTCACLLIFMTPIFLMLRTGRDASVQYWFGSWCDIAAFLPCLFIVGHIVHSNKRRPDKATVVVCLILPAVTLLILGECVLQSVSTKANQLFSTDCDTFSEKRALETEHIAAQNVFATCLADTVSSIRARNLTFEHAAELYRIQDCEEYESELQAHQRAWTYLRHLEEQHQCAGWCSSGQPVWTYGEVKDSCSVAVSTVLDGKIKHMASQTVAYSILVIFIVSIALLVVGNPLRQAGISW